MNNKIKESKITNNNELKQYLICKAQNHNSYKYYASREKIETIIKSGCIYLSNGNNWNDIIDRSNFNSPNAKYQNFGLCLSYSKSENIAMWMLYSGNEGLMINYDKAIITHILSTQKILLGYFDKNDHTFKCRQVLKKPNFEIFIIDMLYHGEYLKEETCYVKRSDEINKKFDAKLIANATYYVKALPWSYENECRIVVSIPRELIEDSCISDVAINLPYELSAKLPKNVYESPNVANIAYNPSAMSNKMSWKLYLDCPNCKHRSKKT